MQTTGNLVGVVVELTAGVQHRHDNFGGGYTFFFMDIHRDTTAIILDRDGLIGVDDHADFRAVTRQSLVDGVIHQFKDHVVQAGAIVGIADVHTRALAHRIQSLEDFDAGGIVVRFTH